MGSWSSTRRTPSSPTGRPSISLADDRPLVVTRTFSKTWSMAGARLGYLIGPPWLVAELDKVVLPYHLDTVKQIAGRVALRFVDDMDARVRQIVERARTRVGGPARPAAATWCRAAPTSCCSARRSANGRAVWQGLVDRDVLVRDCSSWPHLDNCLRVTIGTPKENTTFIDALAAVLGDPSIRQEAS